MDLMTLLAKLTLDKSQYDEGLKEAEKDANGLTIPTPVIPKTDNTQFQDGLKEAEETGNWFKEVMSGVWEGVKSAIITTGILGLVTSIIGAMREGISLAAQNGKTISDGAKNLGMSTKAYQEYDYVLKKSNLSMKDLSTAMKQMDNLRAGKKTTTEQAQWLEKLGINAEKAASSEQLLGQVMDSLVNYNGSDKGAIINWLFGSNQNWDGFFSQTEEDIAALKKEADDLGLIMSDESVQNAVEFSDATERLASRLESIKTSFGESILPLLTSAVKEVEKIIAFFSGGSKSKSLSDQFADDDKAFSEELSTIESTAAAAETLADKLLAMGDTSQMTAEQYEIWKGTAEALIGLVPELGSVIDTETGKISANSEEIKENIKQWENLAKQKALQTLKEEKYQEIVEKNKEMIDKSVEANKKAAEAEGARAKSLEGINEVLSSYGFDKLGENATVEDVRSAISNALLNYEGDEYGLAQLSAALTNASAEWQQADNNAKQAQAEVERLTEELQKGEEEYTAWLQAAESMYGIALSEADGATSSVNSFISALEKIPLDKTVHIHAIYDDFGHGHAIGSAYIPYDNYPALLHRGERVLTATENRRGTGDTGNAREIVSAIQSLKNDMANMKIVVGQKVFGRTVVDYGGRRLSNYIGNADSKLAAGYGT